MTKCPKCKEDISYLEYTKTIEGTTEYIDDGLSYDDDTNVSAIIFFCPECLEPLFQNHAEAEDFLKGDKIAKDELKADLEEDKRLGL